MICRKGIKFNELPIFMEFKIFDTVGMKTRKQVEHPKHYQRYGPNGTYNNKQTVCYTADIFAVLLYKKKVCVQTTIH